MGRAIKIDAITHHFVHYVVTQRSAGKFVTNKEIAVIIGVKRETSITEILGKRSNIQPEQWRKFKDHFNIPDDYAAPEISVSRGTSGKKHDDHSILSDKDLYIQSLNERIAEHKERINEVKEILGGVNTWLQDLVKSNLGTLLANQGVTQETIRVLLERDVHKESGGNQKKEREILNQIRAEILQNTGLNVKLGTHDGAGTANK